MSRDDDITRPITLPPLMRHKCMKPITSKCNFRDKDGRCTKQYTTCPWKAKERTTTRK